MQGVVNTDIKDPMNIAYKLMLQELVEGCLKENRNAQRKLYEYFYGKMMSICLRYAGTREEAVEILNQGFYKVFKSMGSFNSAEGALEAWIRRIMINTAIDHYRKMARQQKTTDLDTAYKASEESTAISAISAEEILVLVQELSPAYRTVFSLYAIEGFNHREIAEKLGISEGTSKSNLAKARAKLQEKVTQLNYINSKNYAR